MILSVLICSLKQRQEMLAKLLEHLERQKTRDVEILVEVDNGRLPVGSKRNRLLRKARGDYVVFVDDDDEVADDYIHKILQACVWKPDCCGIMGQVRFRRRNIIRSFVHSIKYNSWFRRGNTYYRCPNHLNPVKRELALLTRFPQKRSGEDYDYSIRLLPLLKTEEFIDGFIYFYLTQ